MASARVVTALRALDLAKNLSGRQLVREGGWANSAQAVATVARIVVSGALPRMFAREPRHAV
jgi:hypothetical protein